MVISRPFELFKLQILSHETAVKQYPSICPPSIDTVQAELRSFLFLIPLIKLPCLLLATSFLIAYCHSFTNLYRPRDRRNDVRMTVKASVPIANPRAASQNLGQLTTFPTSACNQTCSAPSMIAMIPKTKMKGA